MADLSVTIPMTKPVAGARYGALGTMLGDTQQAVKSAVHRDLINKLDLEKLYTLEDANVRRQLLTTIFQMVSEQGIPFSALERERIANEVLDEVLGLGPLEPLLQDPSVNDILVNTANMVYVERRRRAGRDQRRL